MRYDFFIFFDQLDRMQHSKRYLFIYLFIYFLYFCKITFGKKKKDLEMKTTQKV